MYNDYDDVGYADYYDPDFEDFAEHTGFLTNFSPSAYGQYVAAVQAYALINPSVELAIAEGYKGGHGLYIRSGRTDLSAFWRLFETFKGK